MPARILIVEDEPVTAMNERMILEKLGYSVAGIAASGAEAVRMAGQFKPDLILMDVTLDGDLDGIGAAGRINQERAGPTGRSRNFLAI